MTSRRVFVAGSIALTAFAGRAAKSPPPPKIGAIYWPGPTHDLHGFMAVPAKARGPQPAVLVLSGPAGADQFALGLTDALARAGFVTCIPRALASIDEVMATFHWLQANRYATGKVGAVGIGWGIGMVEQAAAQPESPMTCGVVFGAGAQTPASGPPLLRLPALAASTDPAAYAAAWEQAVAFLGDHLGLPDKRRKP